MALWQFSVRIVPKDVLKAWKGEIPLRLPAGYFTELPSFELKTFKTDIFFLIETEFERNPDSKGDIIKWGRPDETDFCLTYNDVDLVDLLVRLDLRTIKRETIELVCKIGRLLEGVIVTESGHILEPLEKNLLEKIKSSRAFRFVSDPRRFTSFRSFRG